MNLTKNERIAVVSSSIWLVNDDSNHHSIDENQLESWQNKWEILGIF